MVGARLKAFSMYIVLLVTFLSLISAVFNLHRIAFIVEFFILLALMLLGLIAAIGISNNMRWAWILLTWLLGFILADMALINAISAEKMPYLLHIAVIALAGFFISLFSIEKEKIAEEEKPKEKAGKKELERKVEKIFKPGKYIASITGAKFHSPKCDWAKKVKKSNAVWFDNKEDAIKAGYKADDCVR